MPRQAQQLGLAAPMRPSLPRLCSTLGASTYRELLRESTVADLPIAPEVAAAMLQLLPLLLLAGEHFQRVSQLVATRGGA